MLSRFAKQDTNEWNLSLTDYRRISSLAEPLYLHHSNHSYWNLVLRLTEAVTQTVVFYEVVFLTTFNGFFMMAMLLSLMQLFRFVVKNNMNTPILQA